MTDKDNSIERFCKDICLGFAWEKTPWYDREYLRSEVKKLLNDRNYNGSGMKIEQLYKIEDYALLRKPDMKTWLNEVADLETMTFGTHLLHGKKYYFCLAY